MLNHPRLDLSHTRTISHQSRADKVEVASFGAPLPPGQSFAAFFDALPRLLAGQDLREVVEAVVRARQGDRPVIVAMGAHPIKVGLSPILIDLLRRRIVTALATNGAGSIHDVEVALFGATSEDVSAGIASGEFGMVRESCSFINQSTGKAAREDKGLGEALSEALVACSDAPHRHLSLLHAAHEFQVPMTIHLAIGSDINHMHPDFDAAAAGAATHTDFRIFAAQVADLKGGVLFNLGSSVIMPTVIEKALAVGRNLGHDISDFTGVNMDFLRHYRSDWNPVRRAEELGGMGFNLTGHHELMVPLLAAAIVEKLG